MAAAALWAQQVSYLVEWAQGTSWTNAALAPSPASPEGETFVTCGSFILFPMFSCSKLEECLVIFSCLFLDFVFCPPSLEFLY